VSGNVSLYNETNGEGILPTPAIGGVGLIDDVSKAIDIKLKSDGESLVLIGSTAGHLGASLYLREIEGREDGAPPPVDLSAERRNGDFVRGQILGGKLTACHDLADGGLLVALVEMAAAGKRGAKIDAVPADVAPHGFYFGEDQARYLVSTTDAAGLLDAAKTAGVPALRLGTTGSDAIEAPGLGRVDLKELVRINTEWLPSYMAAE
jgi:phosphoribosylformylglycinamidine synthase